MAGNLGWAQSTIQPRDRILGEAITESSMVTLEGNVHPALAHAERAEAVDASFPMEHLILLLQPDEAQQAALDQLVERQQDPHSSEYHKFLSPDQFAARFGASPNDLAKITGWLSHHGFTVDEVAPNRLSIVFSGDAYAVQSAFRTEVKQYRVNGEIHHANASDPQIPAALSGVVRGIVKMHDFRARSYSHGLRALGGSSPQYTGSGIHYLAPADFATIYDVNSLYSAGLNGAGQSVAVVGRSNVNLSDVESFRGMFGLPANNPTVIVAQGTDPGFTNDGDSTEATLDVEWAGALAPQAQVKLVVAKSTSAADGVDLASLYAVTHNVAPVLSVSFGQCEAFMRAYNSSNGSGTELAFYNSLWEEASAQGMSVFVSAGDSGAAGCDSSTADTGSIRGVNGICSSPYSTCVGGTEFNEGNNPGAYWLAGNNSVLGSAQSYIPEVVWNQSLADGGSGLAAGGGGASIQWPKPAWQVGSGVPNDGYRDVPDIALTAATHDGYLLFLSGSVYVIGGTSAPAPSFAGLFTMVNEKYSNTQGNINPVLYPLAVHQAQGGAAVFHDIQSGNNTVPGVAGYSAGVGYDQASGLGSVDAALLVNHWQDVSPQHDFTLTVAPSTVTVQAGHTATITATLAVSSFNGAISLTASGLPSGVTTVFTPATVPAPGSGTSSLQFFANPAAVSGTYTITITATGGGISNTATVVLTVNAIPPSCTLALSSSSLSLSVGQATNVRLTCTAPQGNLASSLGLAVTGRPAGVTTSFSPPALVPGTGLSTLTVAVGSSAAAGSYTLGVTAGSGSFSQTVNLALTIAVPPTFTLTLNESLLSATQNVPAQVQITSAHTGAFNSAIALSSTGLPFGMTVAFAPSQIAAPGDGSSVLTVTPSLSTPPGIYPLNVIATGGSQVKAIPLLVRVTAAPNFSLTADQTAATVYAGQAAAVVNLTVRNLTAGFNSSVALSVSGLPSGVTAAFSHATLSAPGSGTSALSLTASSAAVPGQHTVTISATGGGITHTSNLLLTVIGDPSFSLSTDIGSLALISGAAFTTTVRLHPVNGFNSSVSLAVGTLPSGITATFSPASVGPNGTSTLTIQTATSLAPGAYAVSVSGTSTGVATQTAVVNLTMGSLQTSLAVPGVVVPAGGSGSALVTTTAANYSGNVALSVVGLPTGVTASLTHPNLLGSGSSTLVLSASSTTHTGTYTLTVRATGGGVVSTTPLQLTID